MILVKLKRKLCRLHLKYILEHFVGKLSQEWIRQEITNAGEAMEKREPWCNVGRNLTW